MKDYFIARSKTDKDNVYVEFFIADGGHLAIVRSKGIEFVNVKEIRREDINMPDNGTYKDIT